MSNLMAPGMVALVTREAQPPEKIMAALDHESLPPFVPVAGAWISTWGLADALPTPASPLLLSAPLAVNRTADDEVAHWIREGNVTALARMVPPFAAIGFCPGGLRVVTDQLGFRPLYRVAGEGWAGVSTSARLLARMLGSSLSERGALLQSQLGWQLGQHTVYRNVIALKPGESIVLTDGSLLIEPTALPKPVPGSLGLDEAVVSAVVALRDVVERHLDQTPGGSIQLTGGLDSRIVLSAIPSERRRSVTALTLDVPGTSDVAVASRIAARYHMPHVTASLRDAGVLSPAEWFSRVRAAALAHEGMADPLAKALTAWGEELLPQGPRLSGLGGEIARGFYYDGVVRPTPITFERVRRLARWRMLANDAVEPAALSEAYRHHAEDVALEVIHETIHSSGPEWFSATDALYLQRVQRWAGLSESVVAFRRPLTNPMLDPRFVTVAQRLSPADKKRAQFLGRLQMALDPELAALPLDDRPAPRTYAQPNPMNSLVIAAYRLPKLASKVEQRIARTRRPLGGTHLVNERVAAHLKAEPAVLDPVRRSGFFDEHWLDQVAVGEVRPRPSSMALLMNVMVAAEDRAT